ncbi:non-ribosomal peptide synthetase, partial [Streptomyces sp. CBMA370]|uniref:non-ribosomal peptide synthetase n=1 Tax=Streptomyces sp. CBMA370 TaxID=1930278 RepID=UPI001661F85F
MSAVTFLGLVDERLGAAPDGHGVHCGDTRTAWPEIDRWAWAVAARLRADGVGRGDIVPVVTSRGPGLVAAWLGVLRSGAAYLPVDIDLPAGRVAFLGEDTAARTALVDAGGLATARGLGAGLPLIDVDALRGTVAEPFDAAPGGRDTACVLYTSGSTGRPKGVLVDHDALLHSALRWSWYDQLTPDDRVLCAVSVAFDAATMIVATTLITGARLILATDAQRRDPALLGPDLTGADVALMTPSALRAALSALAPGTATRLRTVSCGGEALTRELAAETRRALGCDVRHVWGVAECPATTTFARVDPDSPAEPGIGLALPGTRVYVLDADLEPVPDGAPGELFIAGAGVGTGYLGRPGLSARRFLPDPWPHEPGARMYRTGDRGARRPDGGLVFLGRDDQQVKIRGNRVETGEVRALLERCPGVRTAAVVLEGPDRLVGYLEPEPGAAPVRSAVLAELRQWLPAAVLPAALWLVDALPLNGNGKVDTHALRDADRRPLPGGDGAADAPEDGLAQAVRLFLAHLPEPPDDPRLAPDADFFMLGGASMAAARLIADASRERAGQPALRDFLADPSVAGLARLLAAPAPGTAADGTGGSGGSGGSGGEPGDGPRPARPVERRLWFLDQVPELRSAYLVPLVFSVRGGALDRDLLAQALQSVLDRHPGLRARFFLDAESGDVMCSTGLPGPVVTRLDLRTAALPERAPTVAERTAALCRAPFDLAEEAPVRAEVIATDEGAVIVLCAHHIAVDAQSLAVLVGELGEAYRAGAEGGTGGLPDPVPPGADQWAETASDRTAEAVRAATERLRGAPVDVLLPHDRPRGPVQDTSGATCPVPLEGIDPGLLRTLARSEGVTAFMAAAAVLAVALGRRSGQRDFLFATPWGGRDAATAGQVAMLIDTVVVRVDTTGAGSWRELLRRVRAASLTAFRDAGVPFDALVSALHPGRDLSRPPLTPVQISVGEGEPALPDLGPGLVCGPLPSGHAHTKYELTLDLRERPGGPTLALDFAIALFDTATVRGIAADLRRCLTELDRDPDGPLWPREAKDVGRAGPGVRPRALPPLPLVTGPLPGRPEETAVVHQGVRVPRGTLDAWAWA